MLWKSNSWPVSTRRRTAAVRKGSPWTWLRGRAHHPQEGIFHRVRGLKAWGETTMKACLGTVGRKSWVLRSESILINRRYESRRQDSKFTTRIIIFQMTLINPGKVERLCAVGLGKSDQSGAGVLKISALESHWEGKDLTIEALDNSQGARKSQGKRALDQGAQLIGASLKVRSLPTRDTMMISWKPQEVCRPSGWEKAPSKSKAKQLPPNKSIPT